MKYELFDELPERFTYINISLQRFIRIFNTQRSTAGSSDKLLKKSLIFVTISV